MHPLKSSNPQGLEDEVEDVNFQELAVQCHHAPEGPVGWPPLRGWTHGSQGLQGRANPETETRRTKIL